MDYNNAPSPLLFVVALFGVPLITFLVTLALVAVCP